MNRNLRNVTIVTGFSCLLAFASGGCGAADTGFDDGTPKEAADTVGTEEQAVTSLTVTLCTNPGYAGTCQDIGIGNRGSAIGIPSDTLSSFIVGSNARATLCETGNFGGRCQTYGPGSVGQIASPPNDTVSSVRVVRNSDPDCRNPSVPPPFGWAFLYRDPNYQGDCVSIYYQTGDYSYSVGIGLQNDSLSSLILGPHTGLTTWTNPGFTGSRVDYVPTFEGTPTYVPQVDRNDTMSSLNF